MPGSASWLWDLIHHEPVDVIAWKVVQVWRMQTSKRYYMEREIQRLYQRPI